MPKLRALTPEQAQKTIANKFGPLADRLRQIATNLGARPHRVFLIWTKWDGQSESGVGYEAIVKRIELLPTPEVLSLDAVTFSLFHAGTVPVGSIKLVGISVDRYTEDLLQGKAVPVAHEDEVPAPYDFFYEVIEDGRGDPKPAPQRYRLLNLPFRRATDVDWTLMLERVSAERDRDGRLPHSPPGPKQPPLLTPPDID